MKVVNTTRAGALGRMQEIGLVRRERDGRRVRYHLRERGRDCWVDVRECARSTCFQVCAPLVETSLSLLFRWLEIPGQHSLELEHRVRAALEIDYRNAADKGVHVVHPLKCRL